MYSILVSPQNVIIVTADMKNDKSLCDCCLFFMNCHISFYLLYNILHDVNVTTYLATLEKLYIVWIYL